ncbi:MAG TPA: hypothetical protein VFA44_11565 [Gaiellaceae bacterium]|nr:hypothetical protein [Gaiellaceae bacterium]
MRPPTRRSRCFWGRVEREGRGKLERPLAFVVGHLDVEVLEELGELWRLVVVEGVGQVGHGREHGLDGAGMDVARRLRLK